jgi:hypothetical protein
MTHLSISDTVYAALLTGGAAVFGTVVSGAISWARDLGVSARRARILDEATKCVQFWSQWQKALEEIGDSTSGVQLEAEVHIKRVAEVVKAHFHTLRPVSEWSAAEFNAYKASLPGWRRFLLWYLQPSSEARKKRGVIYTGPILLILYTIVFRHWPFLLGGSPISFRLALIAIPVTLISLFPIFRLGVIRTERKYVQSMPKGQDDLATLPDET